MVCFDKKYLGQCQNILLSIKIVKRTNQNVLDSFRSQALKSKCVCFRYNIVDITTNGLWLALY
jgi:hypothetical protein